MGDLGSLRLYVLGVDLSTAFMSLSHITQGDCKFHEFVLGRYVSVNADWAVIQYVCDNVSVNFKPDRKPPGEFFEIAISPGH